MGNSVVGVTASHCLPAREQPPAGLHLPQQPGRDGRLPAQGESLRTVGAVALDKHGLG
ncbi:hypothetical protein Srubr_35370 [Streptomyces rubradiris]|uniref:Uncharacterized protein n=1 Tax=Streptomyces rubradiris TaxID=285531 RepID=A0ABQ3RCV7_STRRR|nr:hypothetical protein GCM10018792_04300 [Streptomyces rubradiris]GHI53691.1 hypothetical protein Srubr_35370 [Streptomyces rubradiris]